MQQRHNSFAQKAASAALALLLLLVSSLPTVLWAGFGVGSCSAQCCRTKKNSCCRKKPATQGSLAISGMRACPTGCGQPASLAHFQVLFAMAVVASCRLLSCPGMLTFLPIPRARCMRLWFGLFQRPPPFLLAS